MADAIVERAIYKLEGDATSYEKAMKTAEKATLRLTEKVEELQEEADGFSKIDEKLSKFGKTAKEWADKLGVKKVSDSLEVANQQWDTWSDGVEKAKSLAFGWAGNWSTAIHSVTGYAKTFGSLLKSQFTGLGTLSGAAIFGVKGLAVAGIATGVALAGKAIYDYTQEMKALKKELEETTEAADTFLAAYRGMTDTMVIQSQIIPDAAGRIKFIGELFEDANKTWTELNKQSKVQEEKAKGRFFLKPHEAKDEYDEFGEKIEKKIRFIDRFRRTSIEWGKGVANFFTGMIPDSADTKRAQNELENILKGRTAAAARADKLANEMKDSAGKIQTTIRTALAQEQMGSMTVGMTAYGKQVFGFEQQITFLKQASELLEAADDWDQADDVWKAYKGVKVLFDAFKEESSNRAIKDSVQNIKDFKKELELTITTLGMTSDQLRRFKIEQEIIASGGIPSKTQMDRLDEVIKKKEAAFANKRLMDEGKEMNKRFLTEEMKYTDELIHLEDLYNKGAITAGTYWRALDALEEKYGDVADEVDRLNNSIQGINASAVGSSEGLAKMLAQQESFAIKPWLAAPQGFDALKGKPIYYPAGPEEDAFEKRYRQMGPGEDPWTEDARKMGPNIDVQTLNRRRVQAFNDLMNPGAAERRERVEAFWETGFEGMGPGLPAGIRKEREGEEGVKRIVNAIMAVVTAIKNNPQVNIDEADFDNDESIFS